MRFNLIYATMSQTQFDTITVLPVNRDTINTALDFTSDDTQTWGYWNAGLAVTSRYIHSGSKENLQEKMERTSMGIMQPILSVDILPELEEDML